MAQSEVELIVVDAFAKAKVISDGYNDITWGDCILAYLLAKILIALEE